MTKQPKPWWAEREFVFTIAVVIGGAALMFQGKVTEGIALIGSSTGLFTISRGIAKGGKDQ